MPAGPTLRRPEFDRFSRSKVYAAVATLFLAVLVGCGLFFVGAMTVEGRGFLVSAAVGFLLAATLAGLGAFTLRTKRRTAAALARSSERLHLLHQIDRALIAAKAPAEIA